jgi:hypothetical protein
MSSPQFEAFLARLYADPAFLERFLFAPDEAMEEAMLTPRERHAAAGIDRASLLLAAHSYERKRHARGWRPRKASFFARASRKVLRALAVIAAHVGRRAPRRADKKA